ncbi:MAG: purine-binding chemotaxis protein CheW [Spirochaetales bacterium]|nr:purine-binding chemotaxis protein CheW [Spirochaetales bacterium]
MATRRAEPGRYLSFTLGDEAFAVPVESVEVVLETPLVTRVPNAESHLRGVINFRGSVIPIVDPRLRFGGDPIGLEEGSSVIVLQMHYEGDDVVVGMLADGVREVVDVGASEIENAPKMGARESLEYVAGVARIGGEFVVILDVETTFARLAPAECAGVV